VVSKHKRKIRRKKIKIMTEVLEICDGVTDDRVEQELLDCLVLRGENLAGDGYEELEDGLAIEEVHGGLLRRCSLPGLF